MLLGGVKNIVLSPIKTSSCGNIISSNLATKNDFFAFSDVLFGRLQISVYRIEKSLFVFILMGLLSGGSSIVWFAIISVHINNSSRTQEFL